MIIHRFTDGARPERLETVAKLPADGYLWLDFVAEDNPDWAAEVERVAGVMTYQAHVTDSLNLAHPSFFDRTESYEMVIFRGLMQNPDLTVFRTHPTAFFLFDRMLVTIRPHDSVSVGVVAKRMLEGTTRIPLRPAGLMVKILSTMVERFMALRDPLNEQLLRWQDSLLDPRDPFDDWMSLMRFKSQLRKLETLCEEQVDAIQAWREATEVEVDEFLAVRLADLLEHVQRVLAHGQHMAGDIDSLVQIHFSAVAHRTNEVMRVLTVIAAIFLPLTLVAGVFGMNFKYMPELELKYGYFVTIGVMILLGLGMLLYFRRKNWI